MAAKRDEVSLACNGLQLLKVYSWLVVEMIRVIGQRNQRKKILPPLRVFGNYNLMQKTLVVRVSIRSVAVFADVKFTS